MALDSLSVVAIACWDPISSYLVVQTLCFFHASTIMPTITKSLAPPSLLLPGVQLLLLITLRCILNHRTSFAPIPSFHITEPMSLTIYIYITSLSVPRTCQGSRNWSISSERLQPLSMSLVLLVWCERVDFTFSDMIVSCSGGYYKEDFCVRFVVCIFFLFYKAPQWWG